LAKLANSWDGCAVTDGAEVLFAKQWGTRTGLGERIHCAGDFPEGAHFDLIVAAVPPGS
jgi:hypothetical protein